MRQDADFPQMNADFLGRIKSDVSALISVQKPFGFIYLKLTSAANDSGFRLAPPTNAPSMSGFAMRLETFSGVTLPPY